MGGPGASRRNFLAALAAGPAMTANEVVEKIKAGVGIPWRAETVDKIVGGSGLVTVKGVATTMMATLDVVQRAAAAGKNLIITHEPTFYTHLDAFEGMGADAAVQFKKEFLAKHEMAVFRFHDHWHAMRPDGIASGMTRAIGWEKNVEASNPRRFQFKPIPLAQLAKQMQSRLKIRTMRVVGDPALAVGRVAANWGYLSGDAGMRILAQPDVDVLVAGECREWEVVEYAQDLISAGKKKALILMGHIASEQAGMDYCAEWLKGILPAMPTEFIAAAEPFWSPDKPV